MKGTGAPELNLPETMAGKFFPISFHLFLQPSKGAVLLAGSKSAQGRQEFLI